jgi:hypothetical protein
MRIAPFAIALICLSGTPLLAQNVDFGDDSSTWSNDGECDDPRFAGPGMTTTPLLDQDIMHDATDCRTAFEAGQLTLAQGATLPTKGASVPPASMAHIVMDGIDFGTDNGEWSKDGECDDRRFTGAGMTDSIGWNYLGADASDCSAAFGAGTVKLWSYVDAMAATQCAAIDFGSDNGAYPGDHECDDLRFEGVGVAANLSIDNIRGDASDCSALCAYGVIALRDY